MSWSARFVFKSKEKKIEGELKIKLCGKRLYPTESFKYLGVKVDTNLTWEHNVNDLSINLNRANGLLFKMRKYFSLKILRSIYFAIFDSYLSYYCLVWTQNFSTIQRILILQKEVVRIINFQQKIFHTSPLFKQNSILFHLQNLPRKYFICQQIKFLIHGLVFP